MLWIILIECEHFETKTQQFLFWAGERLHRALDSTHIMLTLRDQHLAVFCFGQASACILPWIILTECEHFETNTWQFLFWVGERLHRALDSTHRMLTL